MKREEAARRLRSARVIAVLRRIPADKIVALTEALILGGISAVEVTTDSDEVWPIVQKLRHSHPDLLVGVGTVMHNDHVVDAVNAGAQYLLSPHLDLQLVEAAHRHDTLLIPGVFSPTEIAGALKANCSVLKLFPAGAVGPGYLKDLLGPFRGTSFWPTGGITPQSAAEYLRAGADGVGIGSALTPMNAVKESDWRSIQEIAFELLSNVETAYEEREHTLSTSREHGGYR